MHIIIVCVWRCFLDIIYNSSRCELGCQAVSRCCTRGASQESVTHRWRSMPGNRQGYQGLHKKDLCHPKIFLMWCIWFWILKLRWKLACLIICPIKVTVFIYNVYSRRYEIWKYYLEIWKENLHILIWQIWHLSPCRKSTHFWLIRE